MGKERRLRYKAANMRELRWNDELAKVAQRWADQCSFPHDERDAR